MKKKAIEIVKEDREKIVSKVINNMRNGYIFPPEKWNAAVFSPHNPVSKVKYRGSNRFRLMLAADELGYKDSRWLTYNQVKKTEGLSFRAYDRSRGILCEKWIFQKEKEVIDPITKEKTKEITPLEVPICNYFVLYNAEEIKGLPSLEQNVIQEDEILYICDKFIQSSKCSFKEKNQDKAFYDPIKDEIILPKRNVFRDTEAFFSTVLHEMGHSTGHFSRLNRDMNGKFGSPEYAKEELRAELCALFTESDLNIDLGQYGLNNYTQYLESWISVLQNDVNELFRAIKDADESNRFLINNYEKLLEHERMEQEYSLQEKNSTKEQGFTFLVAENVRYSEYGKVISGISSFSDALKYMKEFDTNTAGIMIVLENKRKLTIYERGEINKIAIKNIPELNQIKEIKNLLEDYKKIENIQKER